MGLQLAPLTVTLLVMSTVQQTGPLKETQTVLQSERLSASRKAMQSGLLMGLLSGLTMVTLWVLQMELLMGPQKVKLSDWPMALPKGQRMVTR